MTDRPFGPSTALCSWFARFARSLAHPGGDERGQRLAGGEQAAGPLPIAVEVAQQLDPEERGQYQVGRLVDRDDPGQRTGRDRPADGGGDQLVARRPSPG